MTSSLTPAEVLCGWVGSALDAFKWWVEGTEASAAAIAEMGPLMAALVDADGNYRSDGPACLYELLTNVMRKLSAADPLPHVGNPPSVIVRRARLMHGLGGYPLSAANAIKAIPPKDTDKTPGNQLAALLKANAETLALDLSGLLGNSDIWPAAHRSHTAGEGTQQLLNGPWTHWLTPPRTRLETDGGLVAIPPPVPLTWPEGTARALLIKRAEQACSAKSCVTQIQARRPSLEPYGHVGVRQADRSVVNVDVNALLSTIYSVASKAGLRYLRAGIDAGAGIAQLGHYQLHAQKDPRGFGAAIVAEADLIDLTTGLPSTVCCFGRPRLPQRDLGGLTRAKLAGSSQLNSSCTCFGWLLPISTSYMKHLKR